LIDAFTLEVHSMSTSAHSTFGSARASQRRWFLALGVLLLILGIAGIGVAGFLEATSVLILAPLLLVSSLIQLVTAFFAEKGKTRNLHYVAAGLEAVFGFVVMANPFQTLRGLILAAAILWMVIGLARLARAAFAHTHARSWMIMAGIVAILLGISLFTGVLPAKLWVIALFIGADFICHGLSWSLVAMTDPKP
jgi:uncharacterized membrane protein HdeD (DUF308 family)